jgi:hypothetical protein
MVKTLRICAAVTVIGMLAVIAPATAQFPPGPDDSTDQAQPGTPKGKRAAAPAAVGPVISGSWSGQLNQVGSEAPYGFELTINARGAETKYPDLDCTGKLTRVGNSKSYAFYVEVITKGQVDKGGRCPDGTITMTRQGDELALGWFGSVHGKTIVAYGMLKKK